MRAVGGRHNGKRVVIKGVGGGKFGLIKASVCEVPQLTELVILDFPDGDERWENKWFRHYRFVKDGSKLDLDLLMFLFEYLGILFILLYVVLISKLPSGFLGSSVSLLALLPDNSVICSCS